MNIESILKLNDRTQLEAAGNTLTPTQALKILSQLSKLDGNSHWKMAAIFAGMSQSLFEEILWQASPQQIELLKLESMTEPLQHHLTLLTHILEQNKISLFEQIENLEKKIQSLDVTDLGVEDLSPLEDHIEVLKIEHEEIIALLDKALKLVWNTDRTDLIDSLSTIKERMQRSLVTVIGNTRESEESPPTGIYALLEDSLFKVYKDLKNDDPALEGLKQFGIWDIKDYWELGILPEVRDESQFQLKNDDIKDNIEYREHLFHDAKQHLAELGLATIQDLKDSYVFSKKSLLEYLESS